jgi:hypothetical protein
MIMRKAVIIFCLAFNAAKAQDVEGTWSGTMSMDQVWSGITGSFEKHVRLTIKNNVVTGTVEGWDKTVINGKHYGTCTISGNGTGELWRVAFNADGTYDIEAISPKYTCGTPDEATLGLDAHSIPIPSNRNLLSGTKTNLSDDYLGKGSSTTTWNLTRSVEAYLIVKPEKYDTWLPEPGKDEFTQGNTLMVRLEIQGPNGQPSKIKAKKIELKLEGTSQEPGFTLNQPAFPTVDFPDIGFLPGVKTPATPMVQSLEIECNCNLAYATLAAFDGGAYTTLTAEALLEGDIRVQGTLLVPGGIEKIPIPKRDSGSNIGSYWWKQYNRRLGDGVDNESSKWNEKDGDGLSAYEEYRGVISKGKFRRLNPLKKEVGIWLTLADYDLFFKGFQKFDAASEIEPVPFIDNEIFVDRKLNRNFKTSNVYEQYAIRMSTGALNDGVAGKAVNYGGPKFTRVIIIDWKQIQTLYPEIQRDALPARLPYTVQDLLAKTVAHELAHGLNVPHHGEQAYIKSPDTIRAGGRQVYISAGPTGPEITTRPFFISSIGSEGNQSSGNPACIMAYASFYKWAVTDLAGVRYYYKVPVLPLGNIFCNDDSGKGINDTQFYFGKASNGNCLSRFNLKP